MCPSGGRGGHLRLEPAFFASFCFQVEFVRGKPPVLTVYDKASGEAEETINLEKLNLAEVRQSLKSRLVAVVLELWPQADTRGAVVAETSRDGWPGFRDFHSLRKRYEGYLWFTVIFLVASAE